MLARPSSHPLSRLAKVLRGTVQPENRRADSQRETRAFFETNGFAVFRGVIPREYADSLVEYINSEVRQYKGSLWRDCGRFENHSFEGTDQDVTQYYITNNLADAHLITGTPELNEFRAAVRGIYLHPSISECLRILDGSPRHICLGGAFFFANPRSEVHTDGWSYNSFPFGLAKTVWIALEDLGAESGLPFVIRWPQGFGYEARRPRKKYTAASAGGERPRSCWRP
jgi:hypothetical protein